MNNVSTNDEVRKCLNLTDRELRIRGYSPRTKKAYQFDKKG